MPERKDYLLTGHLPGYKTVEFILRPVLSEERVREDNYSKLAVCQAGINLPTKTVAETQRKLVIPNSQPLIEKCICQGANNIVLVFRSVGDEDVV